MKVDLWPQQRERLFRRWPELVAQLDQTAVPPNHLWQPSTPQPTLICDGLHMASGYDAMAEAELQATRIPADAEKASVYGLGCGLLPSVLLQRESLKSLHVVLLNAAVARSCFSHYPMECWLEDPRVHLHMATPATPLQFPFAAIPPSLMLASEEAAPLRDRVWLELSTPFIQQKQSDSAKHWQQRLQENRDLIAKDGDAAILKDQCPDGQVLVAGAGPSLSDYAPILGQRGDTPLIATSSALRPLALAGVLPDVVVVIDGDADLVPHHFDDLDLGSYAEIPLVYFPRVHHQVLSRWSGPRLTAYPEGSAHDEPARKHPKQRLFSAGSVIHPAIDLAVLMGGNEIVLFGADFCFPDHQSHAEGAAHNHEVAERYAGHWVMNVVGEKIPTSASMRGYLRDLESYIARHPHRRFVTVTHKGARIAGAETCHDVAGEA